MIPDESRAREVAEKVLALASADEVRVNLGGGRAANTRFALNSITTCGDTDALFVAVTAYFGRRHATASASENPEMGSPAGFWISTRTLPAAEVE